MDIRFISFLLLSLPLFSSLLLYRSLSLSLSPFLSCQFHVYYIKNLLNSRSKMVGLNDNRIRMGPMWFEIQLYDEFFTVNVVKIPISAIKLILKLHLKLEWPLESIALFHLFGVSFVFCLKGTTHRASNVVVWCRNSGSSLHNCTKQKRGRKKNYRKKHFLFCLI